MRTYACGFASLFRDTSPGVSEALLDRVSSGDPFCATDLAGGEAGDGGEDGLDVRAPASLGGRGPVKCVIGDR